LYKVVKQYGFNSAMGNPVPIDNNVYVPLDEEERLMSAEEKKARDAERKAEEEKVFNDAVDAKVKRILSEREAETELKRASIIEEARTFAKAITSDVKDSVAATLEKTVKECDSLMEQAKKDGYAEGYKNGHTEATAKYKKFIDGAAALMGEINARKEAYYISNEKELRETLFLITQKIVKAELEVNPLVIENIIADAAKGYRNSDYLRISIADGEITEKIKTDKNFAKKLIPYIKDIEFEILPEADESTIILDDEHTIVDASIPTQLDFLKEILKNTRGDSDN